ncbi:MAG: PQQ-binding-like beta-propeller repeat protein [Planctomycetales bacterium]|nr:PQQ-binding-like beta-propeller repeat protein [Planctomycetales bacterium]
MEDVESGFGYAVSMNSYVQSLIAAKPGDYSEVITQLRRRIDQAASELFGQSSRSTDAAPLHELIDSYFLSTSGDDALLRLGDIAFRNGHFATARGYWKRISADLMQIDSARYKCPTAAYPDTDIDIATIRARLVLADILESKLDAAKSGLAQLRELHPAAQGFLGGVEVDLHGKLQSMLDDRAKRITIPSRRIIDLTFEPEWRGSLPDDVRSLPQTTDRPVSRPEIGPMACGECILFQHRNRVLAFQSATGNHVPWCDNSEGEIFSNDSASAIHDTLPRISTDRSVVYSVFSDEDANVERVVGLSVADDGRIVSDIEVSSGDADARSRIAGPILPVGERIFAVLETNTSVAEIHAICMTDTGTLWKTLICRATSYSDSIANNVAPIVAEGFVVVVTNAGCVAALDADSGTVRWITTYRRSDTQRKNLLDRPWFRYRQQTVPVTADGIIFAAPADYDGMLALDLFSGQVIWSTRIPRGSFDAIDMLGVTERHVIAGGRRLWWLDRRTGEPSALGDDSASAEADRPSNPFPRELQAGVAPNGRGLLHEGFVYWPTRNDDGEDNIYIFDADDGTMPRQPFQLSAANVESGNLIVTGGTLIVAGRKEMAGFPFVMRRLVNPSTAKVQ